MLSRRALLSMLMFVSMVGVLQSEALAQAPAGNGKVTVSTVTYSANTNINGFYHVELYYETYEMVVVNGMPTGYQIVRSELHNGSTTVSPLPMGPMTYYIHLKDHNDLVEGRMYTWKVRPTKIGPNGDRVPDLDLPVFSQGQTMAVAP